MRKEKTMPHGSIQFSKEANEQINKSIGTISKTIVVECADQAKKNKLPAFTVIPSSYIALVQVIGQLCDNHHKGVCAYLKKMKRAPKGPVM